MLNMITHVVTVIQYHLYLLAGPSWKHTHFIFTLLTRTRSFSSHVPLTLNKLLFPKANVECWLQLLNGIAFIFFLKAPLYLTSKYRETIQLGEIQQLTASHSHPGDVSQAEVSYYRTSRIQLTH